MNWYKTLDIQQRINLKELCPLIVGVLFTDLLKLFSFDEVIDILHNKLKLEGFEV